MYLSILLPSILALYALYKRKLTMPGIILAWLIGIVVTYYGGYLAFFALALTFILTIISDHVKKTVKDTTRNIYQIISNVLTAGLCIILYTLTDGLNFYTMYYAVLAASLGDTLASSLGTFSKNEPINLFTGKKLKKGESGGVSYTGLIASLSGGIIMGTIYLSHVFDYWGMVVIVLAGLVGSLADSVMGTKLQAQYKCQVCKERVEDKNHCQKPAKLISGHPAFDNNMVNLLANIVVFILSYLCLLMIR